VSATSLAMLLTDEKSARNIADLFAEHFAGDEIATAAVDEGQGRWRVTIYFRDPPDTAAVRALATVAAGAKAGRQLTFARVAAKDWVGESLAGLKPVAAGRFVVHGAHDRARVAVNRIGIEIEAALAFGTGHHGTTRGCLLALDRLCKSMSKQRPIFPSPCKGEAPSAPRADGGGGPWARRGARTPTRLAAARRPPPFRGRHRVLDLGTGSGVLAIAAARALRRPVLATDIDPSAVRVARANARLNRAGATVEVVTAGGVAGPRLRARAPFDLVFANILLRPLQRLASPLLKITAPGGRVVLSGLLTAQANAAIAAYRTLALERRIEIDGWTTLVLKRHAFKRHSRPRAAVARRRSGP
jgi:ribosomal protein L11 methyltransferase